MKANFRNPFFVALIGMLVMASIFIFIPLNLFDGEVAYDNGLPPIKQPIALGYLFGIGISEGDSLEGVLQIRLLTKGYVMAVLLIAGFPSLIGYRVWIGNQSKERQRQEASGGKSKEPKQS